MPCSFLSKLLLWADYCFGSFLYSYYFKNDSYLTSPDSKLSFLKSYFTQNRRIVPITYNNTIIEKSKKELPLVLRTRGTKTKLSIEPKVCPMPFR